MATTTVAPAPSLSTLQKIENWFHKAKVTIEADLAKIVGPSLATEIETAFGGILKTAEGQIAQAMVTEAADAVTGQINVSQAVDATVAAIAKTGKTISQSAATALVAAAQQKVASLAQSASS
jgi:hypothetical protein